MFLDLNMHVFLETGEWGCAKPKTTKFAHTLKIAILKFFEKILWKIILYYKLKDSRFSKNFRGQLLKFFDDAKLYYLYFQTGIWQDHSVGHGEVI